MHDPEDCTGPHSTRDTLLSRAENLPEDPVLRMFCSNSQTPPGMFNARIIGDNSAIT